MNYRTSKCIIKDSLKIRSLLNKKFSEEGVFKREVVNDARFNGLRVTESSLSRYLKHGNVRYSISASDIQWLCNRYNIELKLNITKEAEDNG